MGNKEKGNCSRQRKQSMEMEKGVYRKDKKITVYENDWRRNELPM